MPAMTGDLVRVHYKGTLTDGTVFDSSEGREPLEFTLGQGMVIPGFENAVTGMEVGTSVVRTIPADEAYGPMREEMVINRSGVCLATRCYDVARKLRSAVYL